MARPARKPKPRTLSPDRLEELAGFLHDLCPIGQTPEIPIAVTGRHDGRVWRRLKATYASGWEVTVNADRLGSITSSSARLRLLSVKVTG